MPDKCISSIEEEEPHTTLPYGNDNDNKYDDDHHCYAYCLVSMKFVLLHLIKKTLLDIFFFFQSFQCVAELYIVLFSVSVRMLLNVIYILADKPMKIMLMFSIYIYTYEISKYLVALYFSLCSLLVGHR